jgi:hypothetical protein
MSFFDFRQIGCEIMESKENHSELVRLHRLFLRRIVSR